MIEAAPLAEDAVVYRWEWLLRATPEQLWPLVSDTNRINQLASMAPSQFNETPNPAGGADRTGHTKMLGLGVTWDESPFEWVYPQGFSVLREFHNGVLRAYRSSVMLIAEETGTRLVHQVELIPRVSLMAMFVRREGPKQQRNWDHAYRTVDAYLAGEAPWPFAETSKIRLSGPARQLEQEIEVNSSEPELERLLFEYVMGAKETELAQIRPFVLADRWRASREAILTACLYVMRRKLIEPQWSLLCPHCRGAKGAASHPDRMANEIYCNACNIMFGKASDDQVELTFRPNAIYRKVQESTFCVGGPGSQPHVVFQARLGAQSGRDVSLPVPEGAYRLRGPRIKLPCDVTFHVADQDGEELPLFEATSDGFQALTTHVDGTRMRLRIVNAGNLPVDVLLETREWRDDTVTLAHIRELALTNPAMAALLN
jgi:hypothetical protein